MTSSLRARGATTRILAAAIAVALAIVVGFTSAPASASPATAAGAAVPAETGVDPGIRDSVVRLYHAAMGRSPDAAGLDYWVTFYRRGMPLTTVAENFMVSTEWGQRYGQPDNSAFVTLLYANVLGRAPDDQGAAYWNGELAAGHARSQVLVSFSESEELIRRTGTARPVAPTFPWPAIPANSGSGRRIVYANSAQRVWLVDQWGLVDDSYLVSGRRNTPAPATYKVFSKSEKAWAGHDGITMNWMVRFAWGESLPLGFHAIPKYSDGRPLQSESELGTYRSAGCVRQSEIKASALYQWAPIGTVVVVLA